LTAGGNRGNRKGWLPQTSLPATAKEAQRGVLGGTFQRTHKSQDGDNRAQEPGAGFEAQRRSQNRPPAGHLENGARPAAFSLGKFCDARDIARIFRELKTVERSPAACSAADTPNIAGQADQFTRASGLDRVARGGPCWTRLEGRRSSSRYAPDTLSEFRSYCAG